MKTARIQGKYSVKKLYARGYTVAAAARWLGCSTPHLWRVLKGERESPALVGRLQELPPRALVLRETLEKEVSQ